MSARTLLLIDALKTTKQYTELVHRAIENTKSKGSLDIFPLQWPAEGRLSDAVNLLSRIYQAAHPRAQLRHVEVCVLPRFITRDWQTIFSSSADQLRANSFTAEQKLTSPIVVIPIQEPGDQQCSTNSVQHINEPTFSKAAVGGTFDHFHDGHRILLSASGIITRDTLVVGVSGTSLLKNKKYAEAMQSLDVRKQSVHDFLSHLFPSLTLEIVELNDIYGPTVTDQNIEVVIVSDETAPGAQSINTERCRRGQSPLAVRSVSLHGLSDPGNPATKLSSSDLRKAELEHNKISALSRHPPSE